MKTFNKLLVAAGLLAISAAPALAFEPGTVIIRGGVGTVDPQSTAFRTTEDLGSGPETLTVNVRNASNMTLTGTYMINRNWAVDVLAALPFKHDIHAKLKSPAPTAIQSMKIADTKQLPPTFSVQYHFTPDSDFQTYAGVGMNWTTFSSTRFVSELDDLLDEEISKLIFDDSFGVALQLGGDIKVGDRMVVNFDVRWMDIDSDVSVRGPNIDGKQKLFTAEIDPLVYALNLGYHF